MKTALHLELVLFILAGGEDSLHETKPRSFHSLDAFVLVLLKLFVGVLQLLQTRVESFLSRLDLFLLLFDCSFQVCI